MSKKLLFVFYITSFKRKFKIKEEEIVMAAEINQKENDMQLLIDGYQVQIIFSKNSGRDGKQSGNIIEELQNILFTTYLK